MERSESPTLHALVDKMDEAYRYDTDPKTGLNELGRILHNASIDVCIRYTNEHNGENWDRPKIFTHDGESFGVFYGEDGYGSDYRITIKCADNNVYETEKMVLEAIQKKGLADLRSQIERIRTKLMVPYDSMMTLLKEMIVEETHEE